MLNRTLQKIGWKTRRWNLKVNILNIYLHDAAGSWGFNLLEVTHKLISRSLLAFQIRLPNGAERKIIQITNWDVLFLGHSCYKQWEKLDEQKMWAGNLSRWDSIKLSILNKIIK